MSAIGDLFDMQNDLLRKNLMVRTLPRDRSRSMGEGKCRLTPRRKGNNFGHHVSPPEVYKNVVCSITHPELVYDDPDMVIWWDKHPQVDAFPNGSRL